MQLWFLNFYKYICIIVLEKEMKDIDVEDEEDGKVNKDIMKEKQWLHKEINESLESPI